MHLSNQSGVVVALGTTQTLAWASSYYLPAMLAAPMARDLSLQTPTVFAACSFALVIPALLGPYAGRCILSSPSLGSSAPQSLRTCRGF